MDNRFIERTDLLGQYQHSLREHTRRKLTYQADAMNAYTGILEAQRLIFGGMPLIPVYAGLHIGLIDWVISFYLRRGSRAAIQRLIKWELEHCPATMTHFEKLDFVGLPDIKHALRVRTLSAMLLLGPDVIDGLSFIHLLWALRDSRGHTCGLVSLHDYDFWDSFPEPRLLLLVEIVVLSDNTPGQGFYPDRTSKIAYDPDSVAEDGTPRLRRWRVEPFTGWEGKVREEFDKHLLEEYNVLVLLPKVMGVDGMLTGFHEKIDISIELCKISIANALETELGSWTANMVEKGPSAAIMQKKQPVGEKNAVHGKHLTHSSEA
ncbi:hypothetical protein B0H63DRAFT_523457 [Podospora didyma]|uniref:Uncharacterized protein n=1 Tax=Podospora didyma TaxID=330526 RepID=A0AAE0U062_9PEZI|nr:hypothetical protein B0H63DRAFT_523457 [Podospora didyma]